MNSLQELRSRFAVPVATWTFLVLLVFIPYHRSLANVGTGIFFAIALLIPGRFRLHSLWPLPVLWGLSFFGMLWTQYTDYGWDLLFRQLPLLILPIAASRLPVLDDSVLRKATWLFSGNLLLVTLIALFKGWMDFQSTGEYKFLFYHDLSGEVGLSALYLSLFLVVASAFLIRRIFDFASTRWEQVLSSLLLILFLGMVLLLSARASILAWLFLAFFSLIWYWRNPRSALIKWAVPIILGMGVAAVSAVPLLKERFQEAINFENRFSLSGFGGGTSFRLAKWESAWTCIKSEPYFGYGTGDVQLILDQQYKVEGKFQLLDYNAHNQYLQTWLGLGIPGLLILLASFWTLIRFSKDRFLALAFSGIWGICIFTESMLQTQKGIFFFALFYSFLACLSSAPSVEKSENGSPLSDG